MRNKGLICVLAVATLLVWLRPASSYSLALSPQEIRDALEYGALIARGEKDEFAFLFLPDYMTLPPSGTMWRRDLTSGGPQSTRVIVIWVTPFFWLASFRATLGYDPTPQGIARILEYAQEWATIPVVIASNDERVCGLPFPHAPRLAVRVRRKDGTILTPAKASVGIWSGQRSAGAYTWAFLPQKELADSASAGPGEPVAVSVECNGQSFTVAFDLGVLR